LSVKLREVFNYFALVVKNEFNKTSFSLVIGELPTLGNNEKTQHWRKQSKF